jgi:hypothetical protein
MEELTLAADAMPPSSQPSNSVSPFVYDSLPTQSSFRLLKLEAANPESVTALTSFTRVYDFKDAPPFKALSYTWGAPYREVHGQDTHAPALFSAHITCNGRQLAITRNLFDALYNLREAKVHDWLWVDALCINQMDLDERASQVLLMGHIFSSAMEVIIWLGPPRIGFDDMVWGAMEFLPALDASNKPREELYAPGNTADPAFFDSIGIDNPRPRLIRIAQFYAACRWFTRAWVIQEALLAPHSRFLCGQTELPVPETVRLASVLRETQWSAQLSQSTEMIQSPWDMVWLEEIFQWRFAGHFVKEWVEAYNASRTILQRGDEPFVWLWKMLSLSRNVACQDKRDKIYSILGIAGRRFTNTPISHYIKLDYNISPKELYMCITMQIMESSTALGMQVLSCVGERSMATDLHGLPSWVPDYTSPLMVQPLSTLNVKYDAALCSLSGRSKLCLSTTTLTCKGARFDTIEDIYDLVLTGSRTRHLSLLQLCLSTPQQQNGQRGIEAFWRTLIANNSHESGRSAHPTIEASFLAFVKLLSAQCIWEATKVGMDLDKEFQLLSLVLGQLDFSNDPGQQLRVEDVKNFYDLLVMYHTLQGEKRKAVEKDMAKARCVASPYISLMALVIPYRQLFRTKQGFLGLGPSTARKGDEIWLLCSGDVPLMLRPSAETPNFTLVGECYLHGFMHGEMLHDHWGLKNKIGPVTIV